MVGYYCDFKIVGRQGLKSRVNLDHTRASGHLPSVASVTGGPLKEYPEMRTKRHEIFMATETKLIDLGLQTLDTEFEIRARVRVC